MIVDLPHPEGPTKAIFWPGWIYIFIFLNTNCCLDSYLNDTFFNLILPSIPSLSI